MFSRNRVNGCERIQVWAHCLSLSCVVVEPPTASRRNGTGVLWVLTGTHRWDDPPRQDGEPPECRLRVLLGAIFDHIPSAEHVCRGFRRLESHLFVETHSLDLCSCTPRVHLLRVATASTRFHIHTGHWSLILNLLPATLTQNLRAQCPARSTELRKLPKSASHVCLRNKRPLVCGVSCVDTLCG